MPDVRPERTGWRDEGISKRHRLWGWNVPFADIDAIWIEYDLFRPKALIEYKSQYAAPVDLEKNPTCRVLRALAQMASLPAFVVRYADDFSWVKIGPLNDLARDIVPSISKITELEYVTLLYTLRGRQIPTDIAQNLNGYSDDNQSGTQQE